MFPLMIPMMLGAGLGALTNENPLKCALMGAGLCASGGAIAPGLLGGAAPVAGDSFMPAALGADGAGTGLLGTLNMASSYARPVMQAEEAAQASGAFGGGEEAPAPPQLTPQTGGQTLQGLLANVQQSQQAQQAEEMARRKQRRQAFGG